MRKRLSIPEGIGDGGGKTGQDALAALDWTAEAAVPTGANALKVTG
jgi:hypothetical protein